jgi:tetratricopeptide (TPR) repeat protein
LTTFGELAPSDWRRLNALLERAFELEPDARDAWLAQLPAGESDLIPLLRRLLAEAMSPRIEATLPPVSAMSLFQAGGAEDRPQLGDCIGPYRLARELGCGGMAVVWLADRIDGTIERQVALKIPNTEWSDQGLADRIRGECAVLASLNHPNIAQLYDAGWSDSKVPYLALEFVDGQTIERYCEERQLDVRARVRLFIDVLRAVSYAHARLVVHRDLKPANVLVTHDGRVKLLDFGIAKVLSSDPAGGDSDLTRVSGRPVTLSYAAPEQVLGKRVTTATDIYALGVMLFELLCGQRPFKPPADTRSAIEEALARGDAPAPSGLAPQPAAARALRGDLDAIVRKALRKDPDDRFETAAAFADDLERYLTGRPISARRGSAWYVTRRFVMRHRLVIGAGAAVILAVVAGLTAALDGAKRAQTQAQNAAAIGNFVLSVIQQADPNASQETRASDLALLQTLDSRIDRELGQRPELRFALRVAIGTAYRNRGEMKKAEAILRVALRDAAASRSGIASLDLIRAKVLLGGVSANDQERIELLDREIPILRTMGRAAAPVLVDALVTRDSGPYSVNVKDPVASLDLLREALAVAKGQLGLEDERTLRAASALANMLGPGILGRNEEAAAAIEPVYRAVTAAGTLAPSNPTLLGAQSEYGQILCALGRGDEGIPLLEQIVREAVAMHHDGKQVRGSLLFLARGQRQAGRLQESIGTYTSIYALLADREPFASNLRYVYGNDVSYVLMRSRRPLEAEGFLEEAQAYRSSLSPSDTGIASGVDFQIGFKRLGTELQLGEYDEARELGESMLRRYRAEQSPYFEYVTNIFMPDILLATGHPAEAEVAAQAELQYAQQKREAGAMEYGTLARVKLALGDAVQAVTLTDGHDEEPNPGDHGKRPDPSDAINTDLADLRLTRGRALLALGRAADSRKPLAWTYEFWRAFSLDDHAAEVAAYWYAQSLLANGETEAAQRLHAPAKPPLDYPPPDLAALRAERRRSPQQRIEAVLRKYPLRPEVAVLIAKSTPAARSD